MTASLSEKPNYEEVDETSRDAEVEGDGRVHPQGIRQDASPTILAAKELGGAFVKNDS